MKTIYVGLALAALSACETTESVDLRRAGDARAQAATRAEIEGGLRQALELGVEAAAARLGVEDGFYGDPDLRIQLPARLDRVRRDLRGVGLSGPLDDLRLRLNRAAEAATPEARDLLIETVRTVTIEDARALLSYGDDAITGYLRRRTEEGLRAAFASTMEVQLAETGAFRALDAAAGRYGLQGEAADLRADLAVHGASEALDRMFDQMALEERRIRANPAARSTELLRRVFGSGA